MRVKSDSLVKHASIMLIAMALANIGEMLFHIFMSRALGPADFGIVVSLLSISFIISLPVTTIQTVIAKYVSQFKVNHEEMKIVSLFVHSLRKVMIYGLVGLAIFILASGYLGLFLRIPARTAVIITGIALFLVVVLPVAHGTLQGLQRFGCLATSIGLGGIIRFISAFFLVYAGMGINGAMGGVVLGVFAAFLPAFLPLKPLFRKQLLPNSRLDSGDVYGYLRPVFLALLCFAILTNVDMILVKHFFEPLQAGYYSILSLVGRGFGSITIAVSLAMFPHVSELHEQNKDSYSTLKKSLLICGLLFAPAILIFMIFPQFVVGAVFGKKYLVVSPLLRVFSIAVIPLALSNVLINYRLARRDVNFAYYLVLGVVFYVAMLVLFHSSLLQVVIIVGITGSLVFALNMGFILLQNRRETRTDIVDIDWVRR